MKISRSTLAALQGAGSVPQRLAGTVTFAAGSTGAIAQHSVFVITGMVAFFFAAKCESDLTSGGAATISWGNPGVVTALTGALVFSTVDAGDFVSPAVTTLIDTAAFQAYDAFRYVVSSGTDIIADVAGATLTGGVMEYYLFWIPIEPGATVTLGAELTGI